METKDWLLIFTPIISLLFGSWITYFFTVKTKRDEAMIKFKEEKYSNLLILLQGFVGQTTSGELKKKFFEEQYRSWLYSSDEVVKSINDLVNLLVIEKGKNPNQGNGRKVVGNIVLAMRNDLMGKTKLKYSDFWYTDVLGE
ncbi:MAG: hypothetical protein RBS77_03860 [Candidatus Moranbacteria bacterium]|jgi:hypothetical protein|nr:hypothetical protein [Candidatus Moranbacteria bacterium]